jgi:3-oxoacyl-ACP reductase-like protein
MSIFGSIVSAIFAHKAAPGATASAGPTASTPSSSTAATPSSSAAAAPAAKPTPMTEQEVEAVIARLAAAQHEQLDWKHSIVDLMKLLKLDSGLGARKELAQELGYTGALDGSAAMNIWLHKQVMTKLAEGGGQVPADLKKA